jgi:hypothetical protein
MKKIAVIVLVILGVAFASASDAATQHKKRTRNQKRIGPYVTGFIGMTKFTDDQSAIEQQLGAIISQGGDSFSNLKVGTDNSDINYQASFGYRFNRYIAGELGLSQYGKLESKASADIDFGDGNGPVPAQITYSFRVGGPVFSVLGILPFNDKFEAYARLGYLFASSDREIGSKINGQSSFGQDARGDSQHPVYGVGFGYNINPGYSIRGEYNVLKDVGQASRNGTENFNLISVGVVVRF